MKTTQPKETFQTVMGKVKTEREFKDVCVSKIASPTIRRILLSISRGRFPLKKSLWWTNISTL